MDYYSPSLELVRKPEESDLALLLSGTLEKARRPIRVVSMCNCISESIKRTVPTEIIVEPPSPPDAFEGDWKKRRFDEWKSVGTDSDDVDRNACSTREKPLVLWGLTDTP